MDTIKKIKQTYPNFQKENREKMQKLAEQIQELVKKRQELFTQLRKQPERKSFFGIFRSKKPTPACESSLEREQLNKEIDQMDQEHSVRTVLDKILGYENHTFDHQRYSIDLAILRSIDSYGLSFDEETLAIIQQIMSFIEAKKQEQEELFHYIYQPHDKKDREIGSNLQRRRLSFTRNEEQQ